MSEKLCLAVIPLSLTWFHESLLYLCIIDIDESVTWDMCTVYLSVFSSFKAEGKEGIQLGLALIGIICPSFPFSSLSGMYSSGSVCFHMVYP